MLREARARRGLSAVVAVVAVAGVLAAGCSSGSGSGSTTGTSGSGGAGEATATTAGRGADATAYEGPGPYIAGTTTLDLDGRKVEVWYPADPGAEQGQAKVQFEIRDLLPDQLKALVPDALNPKYETNAYRDLAGSRKGPFPLVLFAHGFAGYPTEYQYLLTHLAQWGMVVAAPDFHERGLLAAFTGSVQRADETKVMEDTAQLMTTSSKATGGVLSGTVDATKIGTVGHSAGVAPALSTAAVDPNVKTFVAMSGGLFDGGAAAGATGTTVAPTKVPTQPGMLLTGGKDQVAAFDTVQRLFDAMTPPKKLVKIDDAGHNSFDDLCVIGADQGGLLQIATKVGITPTDQITKLFNDGCTADYLAATQVWPVTRHFVTAQLRYALGLDPFPVGLDPSVAAGFAPVQVTYTVVP